MNSRGRLLFALVLGLLLAGCARTPLASVTPADREVIAATLMRDIEVLASDEFGGRKPGTDGEFRTVEFLMREMRSAGLVSGTNDPGSAWRAPVELLSLRLDGGAVSFEVGGRTIELDDEEAVILTGRSRNLLADAEIVFLGNGVGDIPQEVVEGKVVLLLDDYGMDASRSVSLYEKRAAAILNVVDSERKVAQFSSAIGQERIGRLSDDADLFEGYVTARSMARVFGQSQWSALRTNAAMEGFQPVILNAKVSMEATAFRREFTSYNVIGLLPGAVRGSGAVLLMAHWDHLGTCAQDGLDTICNGAVDNASGLAVMLELSRRLAANGPHDRDIYVLATSAEELGLFGARAFIENPPIPLNTITAAFNFDTVAVAPAGSPVGFIGEGRTPLDETIKQVVTASGRELGNRDFAESFLRRHDGWAFLDQGVPAVLLSSTFSSAIVAGPYLAENYHRPSDEAAKIELGGAIDDLLLHEELVTRFASTQLYLPPEE